MKKSHLFTISSFAILALVSCGAKGYNHPKSNELRHYSADLNHDGKIEDTDTIKETNLTWAEAYDTLLAESNDVSLLDKFADNMGIAKNEPERTNLARYEIMHQAEELVMSTGALIPLYNYQDPYLLKKNVSGLYCSGIGGKFFDQLLKDDKEGGDFSFSIGTKANSFDPAVNDDSSTATVLINCLSGICKWEKDEQELPQYPRTYNAHVAVNSDIVSSFTKTPNKDKTATYTFEIKQGLKFTSGKSVTAKNFIWAWNRAASAFTGTWTHMFDCIEGYSEWKEKSAKLVADEKKSWDINFADPNNKETYAGMSGITLDDEYKFSVKLINDCAYFMDLLAFPAYMPLDMDTINECDKNKDVWWLNPKTFSTNGPLKVAELKNVEGEGVKLTKWDDYNGDQKAKINSIYLAFLDSDSAMWDKYENGSLDMIDSISTSLIKTVKASRPDEWKVADQVGIYYFLHNVNDNSFDIKANQSESDRENIRKAFNLLINRHDYTETIVRSGATDASGFVSTGIIEKCVPGTNRVTGESEAGDNGLWCKRIDPQTGIAEDGPFDDSKLKTFTLATADWHERSLDMSQYWNTESDKLGYTKHWLENRGKGGFYDTVTDTGKSQQDVMDINIKKAIELAKSAGIQYTGDINTGRFTNFPSVTVTTNTGTGHEALCERMQAYLKQFGIDVKIETQEWNAFQTTKKRGAFAIARNGWIADFSDPKTYLTICESTNDNNDTQLGKDSWHSSR